MLPTNSRFFTNELMERENFSSKFGALMVITGSAVGLGNIWRFPYMVGANGGAAFILLYIFFVVAICLPVMIAETTIGRRSRTSAFNGIHTLSGGRKAWKWLSIIYLVAPTIITFFYCVIGGYTIEYFFLSLGLKLPWEGYNTLIWALTFLALNGIIIMGGVQKGIERFSKVMMPMLFLIIVLMAVRAMTLPSAPGISGTAADGVRFLFNPDFSKITAKTAIAALGQAFFSLSIGSGVLMTYGSYLGRSYNIRIISWQIALSDMFFAIIAGLAVIPSVFALKADPSVVLSNNTDSALVFNILPEVFPMMPLGEILQPLFFFALILAALTSSISQFEVPVSYLVTNGKISRTKASLVLLAVFAMGCSLCALVPKAIQIFDAMASNWLLPIGGLLAVMFLGWFYSREEFKDEFTSNGRYPIKDWIFKLFLVLVKYVSPIGILAIFLSQAFR